MRPSKRQFDEMRAISFERNVSKHAEGSCLVKFGDTHVLCTASLEEKVPGWMRNSGKGWVTAEYGMLPRSTGERMRREASAGKQGGRTLEIQRLIGRSLRAVVDLQALGEQQITVDCDVIQADGGTRTASITGGWVALHDCLRWMEARQMVSVSKVLKDHVAAISCGIHDGQPVLDLDYVEDSSAGTDANFVMTGKGGIVEIQGTAEGVPFSEEEFAALMALARKGIARLVTCSRWRWHEDRPRCSPRCRSSNPRSTSTDLARGGSFLCATCSGCELHRRKVEGRHVFFRCGAGRAAAVQRRGDAECRRRRTPSCRCRRMARPAQGHLCFAATAEEIDALESAVWKTRASPSRPISNGRRAAARSISAIRPAIRIEFAEPRIWGF